MELRDATCPIRRLFVDVPPSGLAIDRERRLRVPVLWSLSWDCSYDLPMRDARNEHKCSAKPHRGAENTGISISQLVKDDDEGADSHSH
jgi:hypothetical protein